MNYRVVIIIITFALFVSCKEDQELGSILPISSIDPVENFDWDIECYEYIPLETNSDIMLSGIDKILVSKSYYYVLDTKSNFGLFLFDKNGKFVRTISSRGRGPGEFIYIADFDIDKKGNIYLFDKERKNILKFDSFGNFKEEITHGLFTTNFAYINDDDFIFFQKGRYQIERDFQNDLILWNNKNKIKSTYFPYTARSIPYGSFSSFYKSGEKLYYCNYFGNNIYEIVDGNPRLVYHLDLGELYPSDELFDYVNIKPSVDKIRKDYYCNLSNYYETENLVTFRINKRNKRLMCFLWKEKQDFYIIDLSENSNRIDITYHFSPSNILGVDEDYFLTSMMPYVFSRLKKAKKNGFLEFKDEKLDEIFENMDSKDNPIIIKFKYNSDYENKVNSYHIAHIN